ncbi:MAG TPA: ATP synthase subunit I [bacterium]|nr:ATP synthase subunit I [bacterium]
MNQEVADHGPTGSEATQRLERNNLLLVVLGTAAFAFTGELRPVLGFLAGGLVTVANLRLFRLIVAGLTGVKPVKKSKLLAQVFLKLFGLMAVLVFLMVVVKPAPVPFLLGLSTVVVAVVIEGVMGLLRSE